jgi:hypothetical protein
LREVRIRIRSKRQAAPRVTAVGIWAVTGDPLR